MKVCPACGAEYADDAAFCARDRTPLRPTEGSHGLVGQIIGERYQVERRLGEGGMGEVYLARHVLMGRPCALKVMSPALSRDADALGRFNREATNASRITHPNVCAIYDFGLSPEGFVYLAMELVEGHTLTDVAVEAGVMPVARATAIVRQAAAGLQAAHDLGIVHRDLKPDNIMVVAGRTGDVVKLVDFGIAKAMAGGGEGGQRVTKTGFVVGTPEYMAPEQLAGDPLDGRADQYALALVFYRLVTGRLPFEGDSAHETMVKRLTTPPKPLAVARPETRFPGGLQAVMDRALARQPEERFPAVTEFAQALETAASGDAAATRVLAPPDESIPPTRVSRRPRRAAGLAVAAALVAVAGIVGLATLRGGDPRSGPGTGTDSATGVTSSPPSTTELTSNAAATPPSTPGTGVPADTTRRIAEPPQSGNRGGAPVETKTAEAPRVEPLAAPMDPAADTALPDIEDLDSPTLRPRALRLARLIYSAPRSAARRRASAAAYLAQGFIEQAKREPATGPGLLDSARYYARRAWELNPRPEYRSLLLVLGDTVPPR
ncbi:MAG: protein kinase domain-containing protein [Gemmatimonadales bacterium]